VLGSVRFDGHNVRIEKRRPLLFAAFRRHTYVVFVDGTVVDSRSGFLVGSLSGTFAVA